ncbi:hypothetical protein VTO73DRAFT_5015 [Trametes versicolor]
MTSRSPSHAFHSGPIHGAVSVSLSSDRISCSTPHPQHSFPHCHSLLVAHVVPSWSSRSKRLGSRHNAACTIRSPVPRVLLPLSA